MKLFDIGWWNCYNSYTNELVNIGGYSTGSDISIKVLENAGVTPYEAREAIKKEYLYGRALDIVKEYFRL